MILESVCGATVEGGAIRGDPQGQPQRWAVGAEAVEVGVVMHGMYRFVMRACAVAAAGVALGMGMVAAAGASDGGGVTIRPGALRPAGAVAGRGGALRAALGSSPAEATVPYNWVQRSPSVSPSGFYDSAMVYDPARQVSVLFGGYGGGQWDNQTWEWDGTNWTQRFPATSPSPRVSDMVYDSFRHVTVLFGGDSQNVLLNDTWEWDGNNWTQMSPATSPPNRGGAPMAYDSVRHVTVLFGGGGNSRNLNDTWEWDGSNWTERHPATSPPARTRFCIAYDSARHRTVLFGGQSDSTFYNDTWEWDGNNWTQMSPATSPPARSTCSMVYDSARHVMVMFGGNDSIGNLLNDTWEWDGSNWTQLHPATSPPPRTLFAMSYDSGRAVTVMFGGVGTVCCSLDDTWELGTAATKLSINRTQGSFNDPITVTGAGFGPGELVHVYNDATTSSPIYTAVTDNNTGSFVINRRVVAQAYGSHTLIAVGQTSQRQGSTTFFMKASLGLRPAEGVTGQTVGVTGHGYGASETVELRWNRPTGPILRRDVTNSQGTLYSFFIVPKSATPGPHLVYATGTQTRARVIAKFTVSPRNRSITPKALLGPGLRATQAR
jgi:hypothetical protein